MDLPSANDMRRVSSGARRIAHNAAFDHSLRKVSNIIKEAARQRHSSVAYEIPEFVIGCPSFKVADCMRYVLNTLHAKGFEAAAIGEKVIFVSWVTPTAKRLPSVDETRAMDDFKALKL